MLARGAPRSVPFENTRFFVKRAVRVRKKRVLRNVRKNKKKGNYQEYKDSGRRTGASDERFEGRRPGWVRGRNLDKKPSFSIGARRSRKKAEKHEKQ